MNKILINLLVFVGIVFSSCVPSKDLIYLQDKDSTRDKRTISPIISKPYRLQPTDIISISIKAIDPKLVAMFSTANESTSSTKSEIGLYFEGYTVDDHGFIRIPVLGEVLVLGSTLEEVRMKIEAKLLAEYFKAEANIFVTVKLAGLRYTINGEIGIPGTKTLYQEKVTILQAIANSGDITLTGNRKAVSIIRQFPQGAEMQDIDLTDIKAMQSPYYFVQPNDYIYVKPLKQKTWGTGKTGIESLGTFITILSLATTTFLLLRK